MVSWWVSELMSWWVGELVSLWGGEFMSWWVYELVSWWVGELVSWWVRVFVKWRVFVNWWVYQTTSLQTTKHPAVRLLPTTQQQQKKRGVRNTPYTSFNIVAETRLEHVTSRLWAWRATNCSTPRYLLAPHFWIASAKVYIYPETHKLSANFLAEKNKFINEKASFFAKQQP